MQFCYADIILPVAVKGRFTYSIPESLRSPVVTGSKVLVQFGNRKLYSGIVARLHNDPPGLGKIRPLIEAPDSAAVVNERQLRFWHWMSEYYMCSEGEVMNAALPSILIPEGDITSPVISRIKAREEKYIILGGSFSDAELNQMLDRLKKAPIQEKLLSTYLLLSGYSQESDMRHVRKSVLLKESSATDQALNALIGKKILSAITLEVTRLSSPDSPVLPLRKLSPAQGSSYNLIKEHFKSSEIVLLHGVTSSGKTEIYIHLIEEQLRLGRQVLYLLPEIALTTQIIIRLQLYFGSKTGVFHSRFNDQEKAEIWKKVADPDPEKGYRLILGVRSSVFLPFTDLGLIIIDEEHDGSYKQHDPAPRYNGRDSAIVLASIHGAKSILGSASPSVESYYNASTGKYALVRLTERYGKINLPAMVVANTREAYRKKLMVSHFTPELLHAIDEALGHNEQVILFQNRRGFSPYIECPECGWIPVCVQCAVNLTYHKSENRLICHYCGFSLPVPSKCGSCGSTGLETRGFGTEKIEDEIRIVFPKAATARMDQDTTRRRNAFTKIIKAFEEHRIDILIGTQMISKGLDFENLTVVGILNADNMLNFPDFRAHERSFQLMEQVSGRAGRRQKQGKVVIQTSDPSNKIIRLVLRHDYEGLYRMESDERQSFNYPPFSRMIRITIKHRDRAQLNNFAGVLGDDLRQSFGKRVLGPEFPVISKIQLWYIKTILIKIERDKPLTKAKDLIQASIMMIEKMKGSSGLRISVDVDPY
jgi:primosomal protein N' (replication factor Y) (superfamily II helicase)